jgi:hypothetical protein
MSDRVSFFCFSVIFLVAFKPAALYAELVALEEFNYSNVGGDLTGQGGGGSFGFVDLWTGQTSYNIGNGSLAAKNVPLPKVGNSVSGVAFPENRGIDRNLTSPWGTDNTTMYLSVLMQPIGILHQGAYGGWFGVALRGSTDVVIGMNYSKNNYGLRVADVYQDSPVPAVVGVPTFLVLRVDFTEGVDPVSLYVNPFPGAPEPATPSASIIDLGISNLSQLSLTGPGGSAFDSIRIGTTYADVAPANSDFNSDGYVGGADLANWEPNYGTSEVATNSQGDADVDLDVDGRDFLIWQRQFGFGTTAASSLKSVPEPTAICISVFALLSSLNLRNIVQRLH